MSLSLLHQPVQIPALMGAVEITKPDVDDTGSERRAVIRRAGDGLGQGGESVI